MRSDVMQRRAKILPVILAAALLLPASASAQKFWGLTGGATLSDLSDTYGAYSSDSRWGGTAGIVFGVRTYRSTTISLEPAWWQRGGGDLAADYINVPLIFGAAVRSNNGAMRYGFYSGIAAAFKLSCSDEGIIENPCDHIDGTDWTIPLGFRLLKALGKPGTFFGVDVNYSIPLDRSFDNLDVGQRTWTFRLMYVKGIVP